MPGAWLARSLACKSKKHASKSPQVRRSTPALPARLVLTGSFELSPVIGLLLSPSPARCKSIVASLMPASRHQDHTTSPSASSALVRRAQSVHRIPRPTFVTIAIRPSSGAQDAGSNARDLPDVTSKSGCDRLARRANQPFADEPKTPDVNDQSSFPVLPAGRAHATASRLGNAAAALKSSIVSCLTLAVVAAEAIISGLSRLMQHPGITEIRGANGHDR